MKTRNGFVSNSSSSSFVIAVKEVKACSCCGLTPVDFMSTLAVRTRNENKQREFSMVDIDSYIEEKEYEIDEWETEKKWIIRQKKLYEELLKDENALKALELFRGALRDIEYEKNRTDDGQANYSRYTTDDRNAADIIKEDVRYLNEDRVNKEIASRKGFIEKIKRLDNKDKWTIFSIKTDNSFDNVKDDIELMIKTNQVVLIQKEVT